MIIGNIFRGMIVLQEESGFFVTLNYLSCFSHVGFFCGRGLYYVLQRNRTNRIYKRFIRLAHIMIVAEKFPLATNSEEPQELSSSTVQEARNLRMRGNHDATSTLRVKAQQGFWCMPEPKDMKTWNQMCKSGSKKSIFSGRVRTRRKQVFLICFLLFQIPSLLDGSAHVQDESTPTSLSHANLSWE